MKKGYFKTGRKNIVKCYRNTETQKEYLTRTHKSGKAWRLVGEYQNAETARHFAWQHVRLFISSGFDIDQSALF